MNTPRACARERNQTILTPPTAWPLFKRSSVAAFERSVTATAGGEDSDEQPEVESHGVPLSQNHLIVPADRARAERRKSRGESQTLAK